jgi:hypothetical protein
VSDEESKIRCWLIESIGTTAILNIFQGQYRAKNWIITDEILPKLMPRNIKGIVTLKAFANISNSNVEIWKLKVSGEYK